MLITLPLWVAVHMWSCERVVTVGVWLWLGGLILSAPTHIASHCEGWCRRPVVAVRLSPSLLVITTDGWPLKILILPEEFSPNIHTLVNT